MTERFFESTEHFGSSGQNGQVLYGTILADSGTGYFDVELLEGDGRQPSGEVMQQVYDPAEASRSAGDIVTIWYAPPARPVITGGSGGSGGSSSQVILPIWVA